MGAIYKPAAIVVMDILFIIKVHIFILLYVGSLRTSHSGLTLRNPSYTYYCICSRWSGTSYSCPICQMSTSMHIHVAYPGG